MTQNYDFNACRMDDYTKLFYTYFLKYFMARYWIGIDNNKGTI